MGNELTISAVITEINYEGCGKYLKTERHIPNAASKVPWIMTMTSCRSNCDVTMQCIVELNTTYRK